MKILVIGQGGREHTLVWKLAQSQLVEKIYCTPGNPGIAQIAETISTPDRFTDLADWAVSENIALTVVGPEAPLAEGIVDVFNARGLKAFGPDKRASALGSEQGFRQTTDARKRNPDSGTPDIYGCRSSDGLYRRSQ